MSDRERLRRAEQSRRDSASFTINEWCAHRRISRAMFYLLDAQGRAPKTHNVGVKRLISPSADLEWIEAREAESHTAA